MRWQFTVRRIAGRGVNPEHSAGSRGRSHDRPIRQTRHDPHERINECNILTIIGPTRREEKPRSRASDCGARSLLNGVEGSVQVLVQRRVDLVFGQLVAGLIEPWERRFATPFRDSQLSLDV